MSSVYKVLFLLTLGVFSVLSTEFGIVPVLPELAQTASITIAQAGFLITVFALTVTFIGPIFAMYGSRLNYKFALILAQCLLLTGNILTVLFPNYPVMILSRFLEGLGHPLFFTIALSYPTYALAPENRTRAIAIILSGVNLAFILGFPTISIIASHFTWQMSFVFPIAINLLSILGITLFVPQKIQYYDETLLSKKTAYSFKDKGFIFSIPILAFVFMAIFSMYGYFSPYFRETLNFSTSELTMGLTIFGLFGFLGNFVLGAFPPKNPSKTFKIYSTMTIICFIFIYLSYNIYPTMIFIAFWGFFQSALILLSQIWFTLNKKTNIEAVNSMMLSSSNLGISIGSVLGGFTINYLGISILPIMSVLLLILVIGGIFLNQKIKL